MKKNWFIIIFSIFISLSGFEILLKILSPIRYSGYDGNYKYHPKLGVTLKEGYYSSSSNFQKEIFVNNLGTINTQKDFSEYKKIIFALGDSFTQGVGGTLSASYPALADLLINTKTDLYKPDFGILNLAMASYGGLQNIESYKIFKSKLRTPEYVFYLGHDNDYRDDMRYKSGARHKHLIDGNPKYGFFIKPLMLLNEFELFKRLKYFRSNILSKNKKKDKINIENNLVKDCISPAEKSKAVLEKLLDISKKDVFILILSWTADLENKNIINESSPNTYEGKCERAASYKWAKEWAYKNNVRFADWLSSVNSTKQYLVDMPVLYNHVGGHHRVWVNLLIAKSFIKQLK